MSLGRKAGTRTCTACERNQEIQFLGQEIKHKWMINAWRRKWEGIIKFTFLTLITNRSVPLMVTSKPRIRSVWNTPQVWNARRTSECRCPGGSLVWERHGLEIRMCQSHRHIKSWLWEWTPLSSEKTHTGQWGLEQSSEECQHSRDGQWRSV